MSGALLRAELDAVQWEQAVTRARNALGNPGPLLRAIGTGLVTAAHRRFDHGVDPQGNAWADLQPDYAATKRTNLILVESGALRGSLVSAVQGRAVVVGTPMVYGRIRQFGGVITAREARYLVFRIGDHWVRKESVTTPARPYLGWGPAEHNVVVDAINAVLGGALDGVPRPLPS